MDLYIFTHRSEYVNKDQLVASNNGREALLDFGQAHYFFIVSYPDSKHSCQTYQYMRRSA
ncbi:MAG: hypothetical protein OEY50_03660, partial [Nitrospinota bacterium]|nr:hypothetical protein [Nitrospinota bacterium]